MTHKDLDEITIDGVFLGRHFFFWGNKSSKDGKFPEVRMEPCPSTLYAITERKQRLDPD